MDWLRKNWKGITAALVIAILSWFTGEKFPIIGGPVVAILSGMLLSMCIQNKSELADGLKFVSKKILQWAVILLGFGMNLGVIAKTGAQSLPIICVTIATSLTVSFLLCKAMKIPEKISTLVGVGSSICGGSAIAATAPVINADDEEVAQAISVIFFFNVLAAIIFPNLGNLIGFGHEATGFGIFAGTAVNDTSSVTAAASTWDTMWNLGSSTLDKAVTVKLTRTLAIIPITLALAFIQAAKAKKMAKGSDAQLTFSFTKVSPWFILYFIAASIITTICYTYITDQQLLKNVKEFFATLKTLSKFFIVFAMSAIGLNTNIIKLVKTGGKPLIMGAACWICITGASIMMQHSLGLFGTTENKAVTETSQNTEHSTTLPAEDTTISVEVDH